MAAITKILAPVDFSAASRGAASYAWALAEHFGCDLTLASVIEPVELGYSPIEVSGERLDELMRERTRAVEKDLESMIAAPRGRIARVVLKGDPAEQILRHARLEKASLIVTATHGYDPVRRFLLGSVASKVLHSAEIPVWTSVHFGEAAGEWKAPRRVLCGVDLGPRSGDALRWASELARGFDASLTVAHSIPEIGETAEDFARPGWRVALQDRVRLRIAELEGGENAQIEIVTGEPHKALAELAHKLEADLIVIGRGPHGTLLGRLRAHAYGIVRAAPCPVVSV